MKVLVTGGSGFIGSHVVDRLAAHGVTPLIFDQQRSIHTPHVEHFIGSVLDIEALRMAMNGVHAVVHLAAVADVKDVFDDPSYAETVNTRGTLCALEAARRCRVKRFLYGSTTWVYSEVDGEVVDEQTPLKAPVHLYTATKIASEYYCRSYSRMYDLPVTILRYGIPYGPRARDGAVVPVFVRKALRGEPLTIASDGLQFRKFIYVEDLAEGNVLALQSIAKDKIYNLDGTEKVTIREIAQMIQQLIGHIEIEYGPARPGDFAGKHVSSQLAKDELGWEPRVGFAEGLKRYVAWYQEQLATTEAKWANVDAVLKSDETAWRSQDDPQRPRAS
ncbi:MAG: NAD-dependent epimerase/dehydratase family protein [Candidatus Omnitrophica bacterium]|nr:NAD-dependent epimerase/dehydratase family protein [Candidatus Omnitrophota bacterium]